MFPREVSAAYLRYWRAGPAALDLLRSFATEKRPYFGVLFCLAVLRVLVGRHAPLTPSSDVRVAFHASSGLAPQ